MIKAREVVHLFKNAEEVDARFVFRYEGWKFGAETTEGYNGEYTPDTSDIYKLGYHELVSWQILSVDVSNVKEDVDDPDVAIVIILIIKRDDPTDTDHAEPPTRQELLSLFDFASSIENSDADVVNITAFHNAGKFINGIYLVREDGEDDITTMGIEFDCCETGVILDFSGFDSSAE